MNAKTQLVCSDLINKFDTQAKLLALDKAYAIVEFDMKGIIVQVNSHFCSMMKYSREELLQKHHTLLLDHENCKTHDSFWQSIIHGEMVSGDFKRIRSDGKKIWIRASYTPIIDDRGHQIGVIKLAIDITQHKESSAESHAKFNAIERSQGVVEFDRKGNITYINDNYLHMTGYTKNEIIGKHHSLLCEKAFVQQSEYQFFWQTLNQGKSISRRFRRIGKEGNPFWIQATYSPVMDDNGNVYKIIKYAHDITYNIQTEIKAKRQGAILDILVSAHDGFLIDHNLISVCNKIFDVLLDLTKSKFGFIAKVQDDLNETSICIPCTYDVSFDKETEEWYCEQRNINGDIIFSELDNIFGDVVINNTIVSTCEWLSDSIEYGLPAGHPPLLSFLGIPITYNGKAIGMLALANREDGYDQYTIDLLVPLVKTLGIIIHSCTLEDERKRIEDVLRFNAEHDFLTGLPNRNHFFKNANAYLLTTDNLSKCYLAIIDIDFFKKINDKYGHLGGDAVLKELAVLLQQFIRDEDLVARLGGEEFAILLKNVSCQSAMSIIDRVRKKVEQHEFKYERKIVRFTISVGIAVWESDCLELDDWMSNADKNLYIAKQKGRNCVI